MSLNFNKISLAKIMFFILLFSNLFFIALMTLLNYYNRFSTDDFYFIANVNDYGVIEGTLNEYNKWSGRWASGLFNRFMISFHNFEYLLFFYGTAVLGLFIYAVHKLFDTFKIYDFAGNINLFKKINISVFVVSAIFYSTIDLNGIWFRLCSANTYLIPVLLLLFGISSIWTTKKLIINILIIIISFLYIGASSEPLALFVLSVILVTGVINYFGFYGIKLFPEKINIKYTTAFITCLLSFLVLLNADGNIIRRNFFDEISIAGAFVLNIKISGMIFLLRIPPILPYLIIFCIPAYYIGAINSIRINNRKLLIKTTIIAILYFVSIFMFQLPVTYITQDVAAYRTLFPVTFMSLIALSLFYYYLGVFKVIKFLNPKYLLGLCLMLALGLNLGTLIIQAKTVPVYAKAYDLRLEYLRKNKNSTQIIVLPSLPGSGLLNSAEISSDSAYYSNKHLQDALNIKSGIKVKK